MPADRHFTPEHLGNALRRGFVEWLNSPDNNRAPGMTCLKACKALEAGEPWPNASVIHSKGCGANMRVAPVGLIQAADGGLSEGELAAIATGAGWVAEEALATGLLCFLMHPDQPRKALQRAAATSGDSDSIACLTGAFTGAYLGIDAWPVEWTRRIEYRDRLSNLASSLAHLY